MPYVLCRWHRIEWYACTVGPEEPTASVCLNSSKPVQSVANAVPLIYRTCFCTHCTFSSFSWRCLRSPAQCCSLWMVLISTWEHVWDVRTLRTTAWCQPTATVWISPKYHKPSGLILRFVCPCKLKFCLDVSTTSLCHQKQEILTKNLDYAT